MALDVTNRERHAWYSCDNIEVNLHLICSVCHFNQSIPINSSFIPLSHEFSVLFPCFLLSLRVLGPPKHTQTRRHTENICVWSHDLQVWSGRQPSFHTTATKGNSGWLTPYTRSPICWVEVRLTGLWSRLCAPYLQAVCVKPRVTAWLGGNLTPGASGCQGL